MSDMTQELRRSVTRADYSDSPWTGYYYVYPQGIGLYGQSYAPLPAWWSVQRDFVLRRTPFMEALWAGAIAKAITRIAALGWELEDPSDVRRTRLQGLYLNAIVGNRRGWVPFIQAHLRDFLLTDNGAFVEVIRASSAAGSRILGLAHLDSARCTRTADPEIPVIYRDRKGAYHEMKRHQVLTFADMPDPSETWNGVGLCAASRAYVQIVGFAALRQYTYEKSSGDGATELTFIRGISPETLAGAVASADAAQKAKGAVYYKGKIVSAVLGDQELSDVTVPLKNVADGFDFEKELTFTQRIYALCIGLPEQSIAPLSGQGLGTGTQTMILDDAAEGEGLAAWLQLWKHTQNEDVLSAHTTFAWSNRNDVRDRKAKADLQKVLADTVKELVKDAGVITPAQGLQWAVDEDLLPREFLPKDATAGGALGDDEKPVDDLAFGGMVAPPAPAPAPGQAGQVAQKAALRQPDRVGTTGHTGVMVALPIPAAAAQQIAQLPGVTEAPEDLHITLAYLGDSTEAPLAQNAARVLDAVQRWAAAGGALAGQINGVGRFLTAEDTDTNAVYLAPDLPGLPQLRQALCQALEAAGLDYSQEHGFTPHITVAYVPIGEPTPDLGLRQAIPLAIDRALLAWGDAQYDLPLGPGQAVAQKATAATRRQEAEQLLDDELGAAVAMVEKVLSRG